MTYIAKLRDILKRGVPFLLIFVLLTSGGFRLSPELTERLSRLPFIGRYFKEHRPPTELKTKAQEALEGAVLAGAREYAPKRLKLAQDEYQKGIKALQKKKYAWARHYFQRAIEIAHKARQEAEEVRAEKRKEALSRYQTLKKDLPEKVPLELALKLRELKALIEQEDFKTFNRLYPEVKKLIRKTRSKENNS